MEASWAGRPSTASQDPWPVLPARHPVPGLASILLDYGRVDR